jgi:hypothetical protein
VKERKNELDIERVGTILIALHSISDHMPIIMVVSCLGQEK